MPEVAAQVCSSVTVNTVSCAVCPRELSLLSPEEDDGVLEGLDEFFAEDQVVVQKKKKSKKLKDGKTAKIKRRKKEVTLHFLMLGWGSSAVAQRWQLRDAAGKHLLGLCGWREGLLLLTEQVLSQPWEMSLLPLSCQLSCSGVVMSPAGGCWGAAGGRRGHPASWQ